MAVLEKIRQQSLLLILIIGLALFAFVISGVFKSGGMSSSKDNVGEVNGDPILKTDFIPQVENLSRQYGANATTTQVVNRVWEQEVRNKLLAQQYNDLGITVGRGQIIEIVKSNPAFAQDPTFKNEAGVFDETKFRQFIATLKSSNPQAYQQWLLQENALIESAKQQSYFNLIKAGVGATLKEGELAYHLQNDKVDVKYVEVPYTTIPDSTITVSDSEINAYVKDHKSAFEQDAARNIQYVFFPEEASEADKAAIKTKLEGLLNASVEYNAATKTNDTVPGFKGTKDMIDFVDRNSDIKFDSTYVAKNQLPTKYEDTLWNLKKGEVFGPYVDDNYYKITRLLDKKEGGAVKSSHILIAFKGATRAGADVTRTKEEAQAKANEVLAEAKKSGADFAALAKEYSDGPSAATGGDLGFQQEGAMVPKFNDFIFSHKVGEIGIVETSFGYHIVKITDKEDVALYATIAQQIEASQETENSVYTKTTQFEMDATNGNFADLAKEDKYVARPVNRLGAMDENIPGLGAQRSIVQWAFNKDTEVNDIKRFQVSGGYAVVQLVGKSEKGIASASDAAPIVKPILLKQKKAAQIMEANKGKSLEELAGANNTNVKTASGLNMKTPSIAGAGREPKVVGAAFGLSEGKNSGLIEGENGVYMVRVTKKEIAPKLDNYSTYADSEKTLNRNRVTFQVYQALRDAADIEDDRSTFY
ncbi:peptidylprolyl isomerase [Zhouia sp. PK063]|uniref:peptidylprolyl isomerase n=1 Tax=Zhouia sp. PK063 TaxID=3373602 RepID=UPI0037ACB8A7